MDRRRQRRIASALPVRIWGVDAHFFPFAQSGSIRNFNNLGAVIQGIHRHIKPGETVELQFGKKTAHFRVVWVGKKGTPREGEIGVEALPSEPAVWDDTLCRSAELPGEG